MSALVDRIAGRLASLSAGRRAAAVAAAGALAAAAVWLVAPAAGAAGALTGARHAPLAARAARAAITPTTSCGALAQLDLSTVSGAPARVMSAATATISGAGYCEVKGYIAPQTQFDLRLPVSTWTGRYVQEGCGGLCGGVNPGPPALAAGCPRVTGNELALATDNEGHLGSSPVDGLWAASAPSLRIVMGYTSEHQLALAAKAVIAAYYGQGPAYSYFDGCSDGGREGLAEAQRYPHDFNGILAGAPASIWAALNGEFQTWEIEANTGPGGHEILTADKLPALHAAVLKACAGPDGYLTDPRTCAFDPASIQCPAGQDSSSCLTPAQVAAARRIYRGPADQQGASLYPGGEPYGSELAWQGWLAQPTSDTGWPADTAAYQIALNYLRYMAYPANPPASFTLSQFRFDAAGYQQLTRLAGLYDATSPDLSAFARAGGKIIMYHGWADQAIPPFGTVSYYAAVARSAGGFAASQAFSRLYLIPAQYHCLGGGDPAVTGDLLTPLMTWVEQGQAPGAISFPLVKPTSTLTQITVSPADPLTPPTGGTGLNSSYPWLGRFPTAAPLWCTVNGMSVSCSRSRPPGG